MYTQNGRTKDDRTLPHSDAVNRQNLQDQVTRSEAHRESSLLAAKIKAFIARVEREQQILREQQARLDRRKKALSDARQELRWMLAEVEQE